MKKSLKGPICLTLCAIFWGMAFSAQSSAMDHVEPYTFVFLRSAITCLALLISMPLLNRLNPANNAPTASNRRHLAVGALCGAFLVLATILQQVGLVTTTTAKSGFITALYIIIVPILGIFLGRKPRAAIWLGVLVSLIGLYFLCWQGTLNVNVGDLFTFGSAVVFAVHIQLIDRLGGNLNSIKLSAIQFGAAAVIACAVMLLFETPNIDGILACWTDILYVAIFSGALGYTLQIVGQKSTDPTLASLIMCLESVFAALGGWLVLGEALSGREIFGCALMLSASVIALLPGRKRVAQ
ncbi:MAG TPA: DMT family transporter [Candidatus Faecivicinus avistercoris]|nr:DMT family transporter [Candidatus Faecivicinus avistercoris]